jgi:hypothetical protein
MTRRFSGRPLHTWWAMARRMAESAASDPPEQNPTWVRPAGSQWLTSRSRKAMRAGVAHGGTT